MSGKPSPKWSAFKKITNAFDDPESAARSAVQRTGVDRGDLIVVRNSETGESKLYRAEEIASTTLIPKEQSC